jgi:hypothetical protein
LDHLNTTDQAMAETAISYPLFEKESSQPAIRPGTLFAGRYRIERKLGEGGMGTVVAAHDTLTDGPVAIKLVAGHHTEIERARLREEVRATMLLTHRNIARTYTLDEVDGEVFIVMELLEGETLAARIARGPIPRIDALAIGAQLLDALAHAHAHGVVHRDVKPANIMCCTDNRVVLMDFGLARVDDADTSTHTTSIKGTPAYMAPEVIAGRRADPRADVYACGLILFEMVTGKPPFKAATVNELLYRQLHQAIDTRQLDEVLASAITRATTKDPDDRLASVDGLRSALVAPLAPIVKPRSRRWFAAIGVLAVVVGGLLGLLAVRALRGGNAPAEAAPVVVAETPRERQLDQMLTNEIATSLSKLGERACTCKDAACGRAVLDDMVELGRRTRDFDVDLNEVPIQASKDLICLVDLGIPAAEIFDVSRRIRNQPAPAPRESAW